MYPRVLLTLTILRLVAGAPQLKQEDSVPAVTVVYDDVLHDGTDAHPYMDPDVNSWAEGAVTEYPIHHSCNTSETAMLRHGLFEAEVLAAHARDHVLRWGNGSSYFKKWFGDAQTAEPVGWMEKIVNGDKGNVLFRCDDIDNNCRLDGWAGHWRGENATGETVICPLSYTSRWPLAGMCMYGYSVAAHEYTSYFASDLHHRLFHMPAVGEGIVEHYADGYTASLQLAKDHPEDAVRNTESLAFFALEVYAYDVAAPGEGCSGDPADAPEEEEDHSAPTASSSSSSSVIPSSTSTAPAECHTHSDGEVHCA